MQTISKGYSLAFHHRLTITGWYKHVPYAPQSSYLAIFCWSKLWVWGWGRRINWNLIGNSTENTFALDCWDKPLLDLATMLQGTRRPPFIYQWSETGINLACLKVQTTLANALDMTEAELRQSSTGVLLIRATPSSLALGLPVRCGF